MACPQNGDRIVAIDCDVTSPYVTSFAMCARSLAEIKTKVRPDQGELNSTLEYELSGTAMPEKTLTGMTIRQKYNSKFKDRAFW